jgi:hypothetical protein
MKTNAIMKNILVRPATKDQPAWTITLPERLSHCGLSIAVCKNEDDKNKAPSPPMYINTRETIKRHIGAVNSSTPSNIALKTSKIPVPIKAEAGFGKAKAAIIIRGIKYLKYLNFSCNFL